MEDGAGASVVSPIEGTPAFRAGIKAGDLIIKHRRHRRSRGMTLDRGRQAACAASPTPRSC
ncbi:MAG: hypothetical protein MZW92_39870 [Comamonadaceae bacterium]|nr:hypothetical protein [Comamonadaceae bacterium]